MSECTKRIRRLRLIALQKKNIRLRSQEGELLWNRGWIENYGASSSVVRYSQAQSYLFFNSTPVIDEDELIVGKPCYRNLTANEEIELDFYKNKTDKVKLKLEGQHAHMAIDYKKLLVFGVIGVKEQIKSFRQQLNIENPQDLEKDEFYKACLISLEGVLEYSERYAVLAEEQAKECQDEKRKSELLEIALVCRRVPKYPARNFREALQSIHFITFCLEGLYQLGRPDRYLIDYYKEDIERGILTRDFAQKLIDCLCIMFNEYIDGGLAVGFMVGGRDAAGKDVTNELTYMFIESIGHTRMIYPGIGLCYTKDTPKDLMIRCCELLGEGMSHPALFNDEVIFKGLIDYGVPKDEACEYVQSTCVEITPVASSGVWVASPYINLLQILLSLLGIGPLKRQDQDFNQSLDYIDFDSLKRTYKQALSEEIRKEVINQNIIQMERTRHCSNPLVSCFVNDCLARGIDIEQGGARYNWIMPSFVGMANLVDSIMAIKKIVYDEQIITLEALTAALRENYAGHQDLRALILNRVPKYGNDEDEVDFLVKEFTSCIKEEVGRYKTYRGDRIIPSMFCWIMHDHFGRETNASPDGRLSGFPLGDGSGPAQGREKKGPTASILSSTKWNHSPFIGGIAVNLKFTKNMMKGDALEKIFNLVKTYMERGGFEIQINVVDRDTLIKAQKKPEEYSDLVVRIGGYSDYFVRLTPSMQEEIIMRTEHEI